jgi:putative transposase
MKHKLYPSDLTDNQWTLLEPLIPPVKPGGRPRKHPMRLVVNALFYHTREGGTWRGLPHDFPPWKTVYNYFRAWTRDDTWQHFLDTLRAQVRLQAEREPTPSAAAIDSQSVKSAEGGEGCGTDGGKKVRGRKRHILVDTLGLILAVAVTAANVDDGRAAPELFAQVPGRAFPRLEVVFGDNKYHNHELYKWLRVHHRPYRIEVVKKAEGTKGFAPLPIRWVVERTFAWLGRYRRLSKDYEHLIESSEANVKIAAIHHYLHRLRPEAAAPSERFRFPGHRPKLAA